MHTHSRTRQGQRVELVLRTGERLTWHFLREHSTRIVFAEGRIQKRDLAAFVPLSVSKTRRDP